MGTGVAALLLAASPVAVSDIDAQAPPPTVEEGEWARVEVLRPWVSPDPVWVPGRVHRATPDSLWLEEAEASDPLAFASTRYSRLQIRVPRTKGQGAGRGLWIGSIAGAIVGAVLGTMVSGGDENIQAGTFTAAGALAGAVVVAPIGAIVGATVPGGRWVPATLPQASAASSPWPTAGRGTPPGR